MSTYYLHDGRNEVGPFTIDLLKKQKLTRNTPIRQKDTDSWMPAEKLDVLKEMVAPRKIRRPQDIVPVMKEKIAELKKREPRILYGSLLCIALIAGVSIFSISKTVTKELPKAAMPGNSPVLARQQIHTAQQPKPKEEEVVAAPVVKEDKERATRLRWNKLISATNSNYGIGLLGGIKDLDVIISNRSDYPIDEAVAKVSYIKAGGGVWKTKLISIYGIPAHDSKSQSVPDVGRGKKVKVSIQKIVSKKMNFRYTEGQKIRNPDDPYVL